MLMRHCNCSPRPTWHQQQQSQKNRQCAQQLPGRATAPRLHGKWSRRARRPKSWAGRTNDAHAPLAAPVRACPAGCSGHSNAAQPPGARPAPRYSAYPRLRDATVRLLGRGWMRGLSRSTYRGHADNPSIKIVDRATPAHTPPSHPCQSCPGPPPLALAKSVVTWRCEPRPEDSSRSSRPIEKKGPFPPFSLYFNKACLPHTPNLARVLLLFTPDIFKHTKDGSGPLAIAFPTASRPRPSSPSPSPTTHARLPGNKHRPPTHV